MTHYELFFFYLAGFGPRDVIRGYGIKRATAYRAYANYRKARKRARDLIVHGKSVSLNRENRVNDLDV